MQPLQAARQGAVVAIKSRAPVGIGGSLVWSESPVRVKSGQQERSCDWSALGLQADVSLQTELQTNHAAQHGTAHP